MAVANAEAVRTITLAEIEAAQTNRRSQLDAVRAQAENDRQSARDKADQWVADTSRTAAERLTDAAAHLAPHGAGETWDRASSWSPPSLPARYVRFGTLDLDETGTIPALAPFLMRSGWILQADVKTPTAATDGIKDILLRMVATVPLKRLRIVTYDPKASGALGMFTPLRRANAATFPPPIIDKEAFKACLRDCLGAASRNAEEMNAYGVRDLIELWQTGVLDGEIVLIVVLDYPAGVDEEINALLVSLAETGPARGIHLLVGLQTDPHPADRVDMAAVAKNLTSFLLDGSSCHQSVTPAGVSVRCDPFPTPSVVDDVIQRAIAVSADDAGPTVLLRDVLAADLEHPWSHTSEDALDLPIGTRERDPLVLSFRTANPPTAHMLMGGKTGYGKSNVLLDIIYSAALRYGPDELDLLLLDFKQGLEFQVFAADTNGENWLPQVSVLSLESSKTFGLAVLRHAVAQLEQRAELFKSTSASNLGEYRLKTGRTLPRMLLIIDEFQVLFDGDDEETDEAVNLLETLARQGRVYGIHLLMASQSISGISGFRTKGDAIFGQFLLRASLFNDPQESQAIFTMHNTAASELSYRGEMILNRNGGTDPERYNEKILAAYAEPEFTAGVQQMLWQRRHGAAPMVFFGRDFARWPDDMDALFATQRAGALRMTIGRPIAITDKPVMIDLYDDIDQGVAIVGTGDDLLESALGALVATAARNLGSDAKIVLFDCAGIDDVAYSWVTKLLDEVRTRGIQVDIVPRKQVVSYMLDEVKPSLERTDAGETTVYVGLGLQRLTDLTREIPLDPDNPFDTTSAAEVLRDLVRNGATNRQFFIGTWSNVRTLAEHLGQDFAGIGVFVVLKASADDVREVAGFGAHVDGHPRVLVVDRRSDQAPLAVVPFERIWGAKQ